MMDINKKDVIRLLEKIAIYLELKGENPFRINAYRRAAQSLERDIRSLNEIDDFTTVNGIGKGTNELILQYIEEGSSDMLTNLEKEIPEGLIPLLQLPGMGGKRLALLYKELNIVDAHSLKEACHSGRLEKVKGFGKKTVENIVQGLENIGKRPERIPIAYMLEVAHDIETYLDSIPDIIKYNVAGSLRRLEETVKDIDFIIATNEPGKVRESLVKMKNIKEITANGDTKVSVVISYDYDIQIDFRIVSEKEYFTTLHHFTGSKEHNVLMRQLAKKRGEKINEYGVEVEGSEQVIHFTSEEQFFNHFDLHYIPSEMRQGLHEIETFKENVQLLSINDIHGDLHMHTTWSDGAQSLEEMVLKARSVGYKYIAITDHSKFLQVANGLDETRLRKQREEIDKLNEKYSDIHIFSGVEMDILPTGKLDFSSDFLKEMDIVIAAIHSSFTQTEEEIMNRLFHALEHPYVDIIAHPTGRIIGRRDGYRVHMEKLIEKAKETNTVLELNANPHRFDLAPKWLKMAEQHGVTIAINTDAHQTKTFYHMEYGVKVARKAFLKKKTVLNTWDLEQLVDFLNRNK